MIGRVTQGFLVNDFIYKNRETEGELQKVQNQLASGMRVNLPSEDPVAAVNYMDYDSRLRQIKSYTSIIQNTESKLNVIDGNLNSATDNLQRLRELAVQMANGIYSEEERINAASEVDQMLRDLVAVANSDYKGTALFGGTMVDEPPFKVAYQTDPKTGLEYISDVRYIGNDQSIVNDMDKNDRVTVSKPGNQVFWSENMTLIPTVSSAGYTSPNDSKIVVDGIEIDIRRGDNLDTIAQKINDSGAAVKAGVATNGSQSFFTLESTSPHQITLQDTQGGNVLESLGLIDSRMMGPNNYSPSTKVYSGNIFDVMIDFRKALVNNDVYKIGGTAIAQLSNSLDNVLKFRANLGAVGERIHGILERMSSEEIYVTEARNNSIGTDVPKATMEMKLLEYSHDVALSVGARLMPRTLLDFLK